MRPRLLALVVTTALAGCSNISDNYRVNPLVVRKVGEEVCPSYNKDCFTDVPPPFNLDTAKLPGEDKPAWQVLLSKTDEPAARLYRNRLEAFLVERSDAICEDHKARIVGIWSTTNFGLGELATILGGLGGVIEASEATTKALSAASGLASSTRAHLNEAYLQNLLSSAIVKAIDSTRTSLYRSIESQRSKAVAAYPGEQMLRDVAEYHRACSFLAGLTALTAAADRIGDTKGDLEERITSLKAQYKAAEDEYASASADRKDEMKTRLKELGDALQTLRLQLPSAAGAAPKP